MSAAALCFDARMAQATGIGTYIQGLLSQFAFSFPADSSLSLITDKNNDVDLDYRWAKYPLSAKFYSASEQVTVPWAFRQSRAEVLHVPHYNLPMLMASRCVVTVHDLIHLKFPEFLPSRLARAYAHVFFHQGIPKARAILTVSESTKNDLMRMLHIPEEKITVTYPGVPQGFRPLTPETYGPVIKSLGLSKGYFLYVGNLKEFKNVPRLLQAYQALKKIHPGAPPFVFIGKNFIPGFDRELLNTSEVRWLPEVRRSTLPSVYAGALALVFPSLYEGFGLPPLEAMACGTPVICSDRGSLPEVVGDAALLVDPPSLDSIIGAMKHLWESPALAHQLSNKGLRRSSQFTWNTTAEKTLKVYQSCGALSPS